MDSCEVCKENQVVHFYRGWVLCPSCYERFLNMLMIKP
jgi:hypothetical protein